MRHALAILACAVGIAIIALMAYFIHSQHFIPVEAGLQPRLLSHADNQFAVRRSNRDGYPPAFAAQLAGKMSLGRVKGSFAYAPFSESSDERRLVQGKRRGTPVALRRTSPLVATLALPSTITATAIAAYSELTAGIAPDRYVELVPITWNSDWTAYQPAGIIAPPFVVGAERSLTDPKVFKGMLIGYGILQAADLTTTIVALRAGSREANPFLAPIARHNVPLIATKIGGSIASAIIVSKLRDRNPIVASAMLVAINATLAAVVVNNMSVISR